MIVRLRGTLVEKDPTRAVIECAGVGYEAFVPVSTYERLPAVGDEATLLVKHLVREDDELLFGFATTPERELFVLLTSVSGVGPRIAIALLSGTSVTELSLAIASGDAKRLAAVKGVGKKTAEKICVDLRDKVNAFAAAGVARSSGSGGAVRDAVLALGALGYAEETASRMVADALAKHPDVTETDRLIRLALSGRG